MLLPKWPFWFWWPVVTMCQVKFLCLPSWGSLRASGSRGSNEIWRILSSSVNFRISDVVFHSIITIWWLLNWKSYSCVCMCVQCVCVLVHVFVCKGQRAPSPSTWFEVGSLLCHCTAYSRLTGLHTSGELLCVSHLATGVKELQTSHPVHLHGFVVAWAIRLVVLPILPPEPSFFPKNTFSLRFLSFSQIIALFMM